MGDNWHIRYPLRRDKLPSSPLTMRWCGANGAQPVEHSPRPPPRPAPVADYLQPHRSIRPISELLFTGAGAWPYQTAVAGWPLGLTLYTHTGARVVLAVPVLVGVIPMVRAEEQRSREQGSG
ncbi:MAG: hypothetical protein IPL28_05210 [Chloroflexi bacterium]|nr:hypothetical protein [Chloroflexota bacterium]